MQTIETAHDLAVNDVALWVDRIKWFELLQDPGIEMTPKDKETYFSGSKKHKTRNIHHGECFFPNIYVLASLVLDLISTKRDTLFPKLAKQETKNIHSIGKNTCLPSQVLS